MQHEVRSKVNDEGKNKNSEHSATFRNMVLRRTYGPIREAVAGS
jgi:hypothetical protein